MMVLKRASKTNQVFENQFSFSYVNFQLEKHIFYKILYISRYSIIKTIVNILKAKTCARTKLRYLVI